MSSSSAIGTTESGLYHSSGKSCARYEREDLHLSLLLLESCCPSSVIILLNESCEPDEERVQRGDLERPCQIRGCDAVLIARRNESGDVRGQSIEVSHPRGLRNGRDDEGEGLKLTVSSPSFFGCLSPAPHDLRINFQPKTSTSSYNLLPTTSSSSSVTSPSPLASRISHASELNSLLLPSRLAVRQARARRPLQHLRALFKL